MADLVVGMAKSVVEGALTKAQAAIEEEAKLRQSAQRNLVYITGEFQMMQSFLKIADSDHLENAVGRTWVRQIRDLAYDVEDCIEFVVHLDKKNSLWLRLIQPVSWFLRPCVNLGPLRLDEAVDELDRLKARVEDVSSRNTRYCLIGDSGSKSTTTTTTTTTTEKQEPTASSRPPTAFNRLFEAAFKTTQKGRQWDLTQLLTKEDQDLGVISIWGTGTGTGGGEGLGLASIAWNAYVDKETCEKFACRAWVKLMHPFDPLMFVRSLTAQFHATSYKEERGKFVGGVRVLMKMEAAQGGDSLKDFEQLVMKNRFLVVLEDLSTMADWDAIRRFFPNMTNGSCIILSTQQFEVASLSVGHPYQVQHLNQLSADHSVYAFFTKVSTLGDFEERQDLTSICGGLPKVIVEVAGSFAKKPDRWKDALSTNNKFMPELENHGEFENLKGLFDWMNSYFRNCRDSLKPCILYLPIFPRNYLIRRRRLVRRWIAEGYSKDSHEESAEMNGEKQFCDLLNLSIVQQPSALGLGETRMVICQVNGFFREYIVSRQMEENLVFELRGSCALTTQRTGRHLVISKCWDRDQTVFESIDFSRLRSLTVFGKWKSFFVSEDMKLLRVLDLEGASNVEYNDVKKMVKLMCRLKFLSLRGCNEICHLPSSIGGLRQLQTLDVRHTSIVTLPRNITKLQNLQYIRAGTTTTAKTVPQPSNRSGVRRPDGVVAPRGIGKLTALHTLGVVNVSASATKAFLEDIKKLTHLRKLGVSGINKSNSSKLVLAITALVRLESLSVWLEDKNQDCLDGIKLSLPVGSLRSLKLHGLGDRLPKWREQLTMLTKMDLEIVKLTEDHVSPHSGLLTPEGKKKPTKDVIKFLSELPNLFILRLRVKELQNDELNVSIITNDLEEDSFKKMKIFEIVFSSSSSSKVTFGEKTMKKLEQLTVDFCSGSSFFGLKNLRELKELLLKGSSCDEALKADLLAKLENHPKEKKPVVKMEEPLRPDESTVQGGHKFCC
ncbi:unnamed protein product [Triticum aestivum]|uniref:Uncharacterized protein n=1 Tax=Triticum aestivum TaxID=4565 RepID=A0A7H4L9Z3_WHEAT|nr:unnamed protein product [Triticum aestivum]